MRIRTRVQKILAVFLALAIVIALMPKLSDEHTVSADTLPALKNVSFTDGVLSWDKIDGANAYIYSIGNNCSGYVFAENLDVKSKCSASGYDSGTYEVTLYAVTDYPSQTPISATYKTNYQYTALSKLSTPANLKWEGSIASWDSVTNADSYDVYLYCITENGKQSIMFEISYEKTTLDMNDWLKDGTYSYYFEVLAKGNGHPKSDIAESPTASLTKSLPALKNTNLSSAGVLSWSKFDGAGAYYYRIGEHCSGVLYSESLDVYSKCVESGYDSGNYTVKVYAVTENVANAIPISKTYEFDYNYVAPHPKLSTPANLVWNGSVATWDAVQDAEYYEVTLVDKQNQGIDLQHTWSVTATSFDMQDWFVDDMYEYRFWVVAKATGYPNSDVAESSKTYLYTVTFDENGNGTAPSTQIVADGGKAEKPADLSATGYSFGGWYTDSACTKAYDFNTSITSNLTLYAKWTPINYTVSFNANGHGAAPAAQTVAYGKTASKPSDPSASGWSFGGWYTDSACTNAYNFSTAVTANVTLYAKWTAVSTPAPSPAPIETPKLTSGVAHVQDIGNVTVYADSDGVLTLGTTGQSKRIEEITINFENNTPYSGTLEYRVHVQDKGWMEWVPAGTKCGTEGLSLRIEAIEIRLTGELAEYYSVEYCVHIQDYGDMQGWVHDGALAGTTGESKRIEQLKINIVPKGIDETTAVMYRVHVQDYGWEKSYACNGAMSGTSGESKRLEGIELFLSGVQYSGGIKYKTHVQDYGWQGWCYDGEMSGTQGESKRLEGICIELYGEIADKYDIYYRVHAQDIGWMGWAKNGECAGTAGRSARLEGIQIVLVPKGSPAPDTYYDGISSVTEKSFIEGF